MVLTAELTSALNRDYILTLFDNADNCVVTTRITTDTSLILFGNISALHTKLHALFDYTN